MTGGQMAPTTLLGQRTTSSPDGPRRRAPRLPHPDDRDARRAARASPTRRAGSVADAVSIGRTKRYLQRACEIQLEGRGFAIVEVLSNCPVGWGMTPESSRSSGSRRSSRSEYRPGVIVDRTAEATPGGAAVPAAGTTALGGPGAPVPAPGS